jgi:hypothetical protein
MILDLAVLSCMPLYATACDIVDSWAPVKLNFWFGVKSKFTSPFSLLKDSFFTLAPRGPILGL